MEDVRPLDEVVRALESGNAGAVSAAAGEVHYADLAGLYEGLDDGQRELLVTSIGPEMATDVIAELPSRLIEGALDFFKPAQLRVLLANLSDDDRVDVFQEVSEEKQRRFFSLLGPKDKELTRNLLKYAEHSAGGRMTTHVGRITADMTVKQALAVLRRDREDTQTLSRIFVVDEEGRLVGRVRMRELAFNPWDTPIPEIMEEASEFILATADQEDAARMLSKYDLMVLPVVDEFHHLLGIITYDDALEILQEESTEDIEKLAAISGDHPELAYLNSTSLDQFRRRVAWLVGLAFVSLASGYVMYRFSTILEQVHMLALFVPMVVASGGNSGGQSATTVVRAMALGEIGTGNALRVAWKETRVGICLGLSLGVAMGLFIALLLPHLAVETGAHFGFLRLAVAVSSALVVQVVSSTTLGAMLPLFARWIKLDPAVVSAPSLASIVDVSGMMIYFLVAISVLSISW